MKQISLNLILSILFVISGSITSFGQNSLEFSDVFNFSIRGDKFGLKEVIAEKEFTVEAGTVVKITTSSISEIKTFDKTPNALTISNQGMLFVNDFPVTNVQEANFATVAFPIWLSEGTYVVKLVAKQNSAGKILRGVINGLVFKTP